MPNTKGSSSFLVRAEAVKGSHIQLPFGTGLYPKVPAKDLLPEKQIIRKSWKGWKMR
jgi:hypothetical protein